MAIKKILYLAAAILLSLPVVSCRSTSSNTHTYRPYHERRNRGGAPNDDISSTTDSHKPIPGGYGLVDEKWAALDVKLGRHDNKKLYKELTEIIVDDCPYIPIQHKMIPYAWNKDLNAKVYPSNECPY